MSTILKICLHCPTFSSKNGTDRGLDTHLVPIRHHLVLQTRYLAYYQQHMAPMDMTLNISRGFGNLPKLYGDKTVRKEEKVTGIASGLGAAGKVPYFSRRPKRQC